MKELLLMVLQILQTAFENSSPSNHRQLQQLANAEIRKLVVNKYG